MKPGFGSSCESDRETGLPLPYRHQTLTSKGDQIPYVC